MATTPSPESSPMVAAEGIRYTAGGNLILNQIDLTVNEGEFVCLLGPSGCGKTTLLRLLGALIEPDSGHIAIAGEPAATAWRRVAYVFQQPRLAPWLTVAENLDLALDLRDPHLPTAERSRRTDKYLDMVGMAHAQARYPRNLSGGEAQRVSLARALAVEAPVMLMDEPFAALDPGSRDHLRQMLLAVQKQARRTIVFVTHDIDEALQLADRIVVLSRGPAKVQDVVSPHHHGTPEQLHARLRGAYA